MSAKLPENETQRLESLFSYNILDTEAEESFDDLTRLAAAICQTPVAAISLIDRNRQWLKSCFGMEAVEIERNKAFCSHILLNPEDVLVVEDASKDSRFSSNPRVTGEPNIRFYAGAPLVTPDGYALGSLCVSDSHPHTLTDEQISALKVLARQAVSQMELRRTLQINDKLSTSYRQILENASDGILLYDFEGRILAINRKFCEITGRTEAKLLKLKLEDIVPKGDFDREPLHIKELSEGRHILSERRILRPDGSILDVEVSGTLFDEKTLQGFVRDVTKRKKVEQALRESERRYRDLIRHSSALICLHDFEGKLFSVNPAAAASLGYAEDEVIGRNIKDFLIPEMRALFPALLKQLERTGESEGLMRVLSKSGEERIWAYSNVVHIEDGKNYVLGSAQDITELQQTSNQLKETRKLFELFVDKSPAIFFIKNAAGEYVFINELFNQWFNMKRAEIYGQTDFYFLPPETAEGIHAKDLIILETGQPIESVETVLMPDGTTNYWLIGKFLIENEAGEKFIGGIAVDITERKQMEEDLKAARDSALESTRLKSAFLTNISHEIRTPMNGIIGMTEILLDTPLNRDQRDSADTIRQSADSLLTIINDILDLSKMEAGKLRFEAVDFDLRETVESTIDLFFSRAHGKNIEIAALVETDVPRILRGDPGRLRQILTNLIGNAVKFTDRGEIGVWIKTERDDSSQPALRFTVTDTGIGINGEDRKKLFQPFVQIDNSTTRNYGGTGLGLAISKQLVEIMNGEITVESEPGKGSSFSFTAIFDKTSSDLPEINKENNSNQRADDSVLPGQTLRGKRLLIADAGKINRQIVVEYGKMWQMKIAEAEDGSSFTNKLNEAVAADEPFDFAVIDTNLPDADALMLARDIKSDARFEKTRIILTAAHGQRGDAADAKNAGISAYLTKPLRGAQMLECLAALVNKKDELANPNQLNSSLITRHSLREAKAQNKETLEIVSENPLRVLLVEDNEVNRKVVTRQLERIGVSADIAVDGIEALEKYEANDYQLILMDCQMPRLDGYKTTREIRRREQLANGENKAVSPIIIIALTAHTLAGERDKCLAAGMNDYLSKPLKISDLAAMLNNWRKNIRQLMDNVRQASDAPAASAENKNAAEISAAASSGFNPKCLQDFAGKAGDTEFVSEVINLFLSETETVIEDIKSAAEIGDDAATARLAHALRGNSLAVGGLRFAEIATKIEHNCLENKIENSFKLIEELNTEYVRLRTELHRFAETFLHAHN